MEPGMPADIGTSYGGFTAATAPSCHPWKWPVNFRIFVRPVYARATRIARCVASVPDMVKRVSSQHGMRWLTRSAQRTLGTCIALEYVAQSSFSLTCESDERVE